MKKTCKYCYGKGKYSKMIAGGTFGDSFDGHITIEPKIEEFDCRCQKYTPLDITDAPLLDPRDDGKRIPRTEKVAEQTGLIDGDKAAEDFLNQETKKQATRLSVLIDLQTLIKELLLRQAEKTTKDIINKLDTWHWVGCAFILQDEGICKCNLEKYLKSNKDE